MCVNNIKPLIVNILYYHNRVISEVNKLNIMFSRYQCFKVFNLGTLTKKNEIELYKVMLT